MRIDVWAILGMLSLPATIVAGAYGLHYAFGEMRNWQRAHLFQEPQQPYIHLGDNRPINTLYPGQAFFVHVETERRAICTVEIAYHIIQQTKKQNLTERTIYETLGKTSALTYPGRNVSNVRLTVPDWLEPGQYLLDRTAIYTCDRLVIQQSPQIPITIVPSVKPSSNLFHQTPNQ